MPINAMGIVKSKSPLILNEDLAQISSSSCRVAARILGIDSVTGRLPLETPYKSFKVNR